MRTRALFVVFNLFLILIVVSCEGPGGKQSADSSGGNYEDLAALFKEFRELQKPAMNNGVPDYSTGAMAQQ